MQLVALVLSFSLAVLLAFSPAHAERRIALVFGNDAYINVPALKKAVNDARAIDAALKDLGFTVRRHENLDQRQTARALVAFETEIEPGDQVMLFFSGHGFEIRGINYLLPVDVPAALPGQEELVRDSAFAVDRLVDRLRERGARTAILVLDACRDNPFQQRGVRSLPGRGGLARMDPADGVFVLMSAGAKQIALDRLSDADPDPNSVFTRHFLRELRRPGQTLVQIAKSTQIEVRKLAATVGHEQTPAYYDQVIGDILLRPLSVGPAAIANAQPKPPIDSSPTETPGKASSGASVPGADLQTAALIRPDPAHIAPLLPQQRAPIASFVRSNVGWSVTVSAPEPMLAMSYRIGEDGALRTMELMDVLDPRTGRRMPNTTFSLSPQQPPTVLHITYTDAQGREVGPYPISFNPDVALFDQQRKTLEMVWPSWVAFTEVRPGHALVFTTLIAYRCAITEVRYGLDGAAPLRRFDLPPCSEKDPFHIPDNAQIMVRIPPSTRSIAVQLSWRDGTRSEIRTIER